MLIIRIWKGKKVNQSPWETCDLILKFFFPPKSQVFSLFYYQEKLNSDTLMYIFHLYAMLWWGQNFAVLLSKPNMVMIKTSIVVMHAFFCYTKWGKTILNFSIDKAELLFDVVIFLFSTLEASVEVLL